MKQKLILALLCLLSVSCIKNKSKTSKKDQSKPNIIVIVADDAGFIDFGFMGSEDLKTPRIDQLAQSGVHFTDAHVSATVCAPSRAGLITGKYQQRFGFEANDTGDKNSGDIGLSDEVTTIADQLKSHNYNTIAIGKWHLGGTESDHPNQRGFDEFYGFTGGGRSYFPLENPNQKTMLQSNGKKIEFEGYLTDAFGDKSVNYIEKNKDQPFFMYLAYNAVHTPMEAKKDDLEKFKNHPRQTLAAMTWSLDENIGKLIDKLKTLGLYNNTLIYFISDNGGAHNNDSKSGPLKGWKGNKFEAGHRVPFIISWPNKIKKNQRFDGLTSSLDIFSTTLAAAEIKPSNKLKLDGVNLLPYLAGKKEGSPHQTLFWRKLDESAVRHQNLKLIHLNNYGTNLYNLETDLGETKNLAITDSVETNLLKSKLNNWESQLIEPLWREGKAWEEITYHIHKRLMQNKPALYQSPSEKKHYLKKIDSIN